jgi:lysophospholipase L1-like esterase
MRSTLRIGLIVLYNVAFVCVAFAVAEYGARKVVYGQLGSPSHRTELIMDRWAAFRNNPNYKEDGVRVNAEGFRRDQDVSVAKPRDEIRIFLLGGSVAYGAETLYPEIDEHWRRLDNKETIDHYLENRLNSAFPAKHWEVINAAVKGYVLGQDLALFLSTLQPYRPDYLILLDGVNDMFRMLRFSENDDTYVEAGFGEEFDGLTKPGSMSLRFMASTWLLNNSALYRSIRESVAQRHRIAARRERYRKSAARSPATFASLTPEEQNQYQAAASRLDNYLRPVRQIHLLAMLEGTQAVFVLQPQMAGTRKPLTGIEARLFDYWTRLEPLDVYGLRTLYPQLSGRLTAAAASEGYRFVDLTSVFDHANVQTFTDYCHLTPAGNQIIADAIFDSLATSVGPLAADGAR